MCKANPSKHVQAINTELTLNTTNCLVSFPRKENQTGNSKWIQTGFRKKTRSF